MITIPSRRFLPLVLMLVGVLAGCNKPLERTPLETPRFVQETLTRLRAAIWLNPDEIIAERLLAPTSDSPTGWRTDNPYTPSTSLTGEQCTASANCRYLQETTSSPTLRFPADRPVYDWWTSRQLSPDTAEVCGVSFEDETKTGYRLKTFLNLAELQATPGFYLTHYHACGTCSSLQDLAVYGELDLTKMAKTCSKRSTMASKKACMQEIGFTDVCAETWAYNASKTGQSCAGICIKTYGLIPLLTGTENVPPSDENGNLNPCVLCDEMVSGPGFQYAAGRTRRDSGIISEIDRPDEQVYEVPHDYFIR